MLLFVLLLMLTLPSCILGEIQNQLVDQLGQQSKRAEVLSVLNMGVNLFEIAFLLFEHRPFDGRPWVAVPPDIVCQRNKFCSIILYKRRRCH